MPRFLIRWDAGYGEQEIEIEADSLEEAEEEAYNHWLEDIQSQGDYEAVEIDV